MLVVCIICRAHGLLKKPNTQELSLYNIDKCIVGKYLSRIPAGNVENCFLFIILFMFSFSVSLVKRTLLQVNLCRLCKTPTIITWYDLPMWLDYFSEDSLSYILLLAAATCVALVLLNMRSRPNAQVHVNLHELYSCSLKDAIIYSSTLSSSEKNSWNA